MLEKIDLSKKMDKKKQKEIYEKESARLAVLQRACKAAGMPVMIVFEGLGASGKGTQINRLIQAMDPRGFVVHAVNKESQEEAHASVFVAVLDQNPPERANCRV